MSTPAAQDLFSPEGAALHDPSEVERALARMWTQAGTGEAGETSAKIATRVSVANLIVTADAAEWDEILGVLAELSPQYPSRTILLLIDPAEGSTDAGGPFRASVSALCNVPQAGETQVCCEQIVIRTSPRHLNGLDTTLLPLLESDVPVMSWWRLEPRSSGDLFHTVADTADRLILDAGPAGLLQLEPCGPCATRELGWYRTYRWRDLMARMLDGCRPAVFEQIEQVEVRMCGAGERDRVDALWLVAFLAGQLGWRPVRRLPGGDPAVAFEFSSGRGVVRASIQPGADGDCGLADLVLTSGESTFEIHAYPHSRGEFRLTTCDRNLCEMPRTLQVPHTRASDALAAALVGRRVDPAFERARGPAAWMAREWVHIDDTPYQHERPQP